MQLILTCMTFDHCDPLKFSNAEYGTVFTAPSDLDSSKLKFSPTLYRTGDTLLISTKFAVI